MIQLIAGETKEQLLARLVALYDREIDRQAYSRTERAKDADFFDGHQHTSGEIALYEARGQEPRVFNDIKPAILWILGNERRNRNDWDVKPRGAEDVDAAIHKSKLIKYIDDINNAKFERSNAFADAVKTGEGWTEPCVENDDFGDLQIVFRHVGWRQILADSTSVRPDLKDANHLFRTRVLHIDAAKQLFPDAVDELEGESQDVHILIDEDRSSLYGYEQREQHGTTLNTGVLTFDGVRYANDQRGVRVIECWYRRYEQVEILRSDIAQFDRITFDQADPAQVDMVATGQATVIKVKRKQMYVGIFTRYSMLWHSKTPYDHNTFPYVRRVVFVDDRTGCPYGLIRDLRDPQTDLNHRRNQALYNISTKRVVMDKGAVDDLRNLQEEVARPDSIIEKKVGADFQILENTGLASGHLELAVQDSAYIRQISGVTGENQGLPTNATSGIAIQARAEQGSVITTLPFDNNRLAHQLEGEIILSLIEQFMDRPMQIRITGEDGKDEFLTFNQSPETNITRTKADFVIGEKEWRVTMRQAASDQFMQLASNLAKFNPAMAMACVDVAVDLSDLPNKKDMLSKFRAASGIPDPNDPEQQQAAQQAKAQADALQQQQQQLMMQQLAAKIEQLQAQTTKIMSDAEQAKIGAIIAKTQAMGQVMQTAAVIEQNPNLTQTADDLMANADQILDLIPAKPE